MQLQNFPGHHLTYCTNIHPGEIWKDVFEQLKSNTTELKKRLSPDNPFGIGLRLSARAAKELLGGKNLNLFKEWLDDQGLYVFTMNGFPYGNFHGEKIKDDVYKPDWRSERRLDYTLDLVKILSRLLPDGMDGGISTSPLSYKNWDTKPGQSREVFEQSTVNLAKAAHKLWKIREETGKVIHLDIEPEPDCTLENSRETISFFSDWLFPLGEEILNKEHGLSSQKAKELLRNHIRVCYDTCHFAVEYEDPEKVIEEFHEAGIRIGKVQVSSALKVLFNSLFSKKEIAGKLKAFVESTYLHQVIERKNDNTFFQYRDLSQALSSIHETKASEWRIHFHVPIFIDEFDGLSSTQDEIIQSLGPLLNVSDCTHFEIETYTWSVLPEGLKKGLIDSIEREFNWAMTQINSFADCH